MKYPMPINQTKDLPRYLSRNLPRLFDLQQSVTPNSSAVGKMIDVVKHHVGNQRNSWIVVFQHLFKRVCQAFASRMVEAYSAFASPEVFDKLTYYTAGSIIVKRLSVLLLILIEFGLMFGFGLLFYVNFFNTEQLFNQVGEKKQDFHSTHPLVRNAEKVDNGQAHGAPGKRSETSNALPEPANGAAQTASGALEKTDGVSNTQESFSGRIPGVHHFVGERRPHDFQSTLDDLGKWDLRPRGKVVVGEHGGFHVQLNAVHSPGFLNSGKFIYDGLGANRITVRHSGLLYGINRCVVIKFHQPIVVVPSQRWVRAGWVFLHLVGSTIFALLGGRFLGHLLDLVLRFGRVLQVELNGSKDFIVQRTPVVLGAFHDCFVKLIFGEAKVNIFHNPIVDPLRGFVNPQAVSYGR